MSLDSMLKGILEGIGKGGYYRPPWKETLPSSNSSHPPLPRQAAGKAVHRYNFYPNKRLSLVPLYDIHYGSQFCDEELLMRSVEYILDTEDCYTFLGGDALETATKDSVGMGMAEQRYHLQEQRHRLEEILRPLAEKGKILGGITGNHEYRQQKFSHDNPMAELCHDLRIPYWGYSGYMVLNAGTVPYRIFVHHGASGSVSKQGKVAAVMKLRNIATNFDICIMGHVHDQIITQDVVYDFDDESPHLIPRMRHYVVAGSFLNYFGSYAEMKAYEPSWTGPVLIELHSDVRRVSAAPLF